MPEPTGVPSPDTPAAAAGPAVSRPAREVHCADAFTWLAGRSSSGESYVTSLPDVCEVPLAFPAWRAWFIDAAAAVLRATPPEGVAIFYQTDSRCQV